MQIAHGANRATGTDASRPLAIELTLSLNQFDSNMIVRRVRVDPPHANDILAVLSAKKS
jgi:hypothetical protein